MSFKLIKKSKTSAARIGQIKTLHGIINTPIFMPIGTLGTVKSLTPAQLTELAPDIILANTYHLYLRPGMDIIKKAGGLHSFMNWQKPILTDSGGFQVFSLNKFRKISEEGVEFKSHIDGSKHFFTPENVVDFQNIIGSDIMMVLDECVAATAKKEYVEKSVNLTTRWATRARQHWNQNKQNLLFGIVQGGMFKDLRQKSVEDLVALDFPGYAIGGLSVGEEQSILYDIANYTASLLPEDKPRYLMGVGMPDDLRACIRGGIDMFDCVLPTRLARHGNAFSDNGLLNLNNSCYKNDFSVLDLNCNCYCCQNFTKAYLAHLIRCKEILASVLLTIHNIHYLQKVVAEETSLI